MRVALLLALSLISSAALAGIQQACSAKQGDEEAYATCIDAERKRAANMLRELDPQIMQILHTHTQASGSTKRLDTYRASQARHVRLRNRKCKQQNDLERAICEGDMDNAQIQALQKYLKQN